MLTWHLALIPAGRDSGTWPGYYQSRFSALEHGAGNGKVPAGSHFRERAQRNTELKRCSHRSMVDELRRLMDAHIGKDVAVAVSKAKRF